MDSLQILKDKPEKCSFCKLKEINELKYGPLYKRNGLVAHYYCVLFSYRVIQNGADDEGILGFLVQDIKNELRRVKNIRCHYCSRPNASVYCAHSQCDRIFHFPCGIVRKSLHQYKGSFKSYCSEHRPKQKIPLEYLTEAQKNTPKCVICYDDIDCNDETELLWANCCLKTWYHRDCLQKFALSSGYLFKCAICNNKRQFKQWVEEYGIFVPKQDASWELEPNAFSELLVQHGRCDAAICLCPFGRDFSSDFHTRQWEIVLCKSCGSQGIHPPCSNRMVTSNWECDLCKVVRRNLKIRRARLSFMSDSEPSSSSQDRQITETEDYRNVATSSSYSQDRQITENEDYGNVATSSSYSQENLMTETEDFGNVASSSYSHDLLSLDTVTTAGRVITSRTERKRKRTEAGEENSDMKKTAFESDQSQDEGSQDCMEKADTEEFVYPSTSQTIFHGPEVSDEAIDIGSNVEIPSEGNQDEEEIVVDCPEVPYEGTSSNYDIEESKRRDQGILVIDLTETTPVDKDEIITVMETYRTIQLSDVRYRVKKEVFLLSSDDDDDDDDDEENEDEENDKDGDKNDEGDEKSADDELEIILHKTNSSDTRDESTIKSENDEVLIEASASCSNPDVSVIFPVEDDPQEGTSRGTANATLEDDLVTPMEQDVEVEVVEVPDEDSQSEARSLSCARNENPGTSSRASGTVDEQLRSELLDKYFIIFLEEKKNRSRLERLSKDIKKVILKHNQKYGGTCSQSSETNVDEDDEDSHITVSSDSETEYTCVQAAGGGGGNDDDDDDDDDDVQIIENPSG